MLFLLSYSPMSASQDRILIEGNWSIIRDLKHRGRRAQRTTTGSKITLPALLRTLHSSSTWSSERQNAKFAVMSEREHVFMYLRGVWAGSLFQTIEMKDVYLFNLEALHYLDFTATFAQKSFAITFGFVDLLICLSAKVENFKNEFRNWKMTVYFIFFWLLSTCRLSLALLG